MIIDIVRTHSPKNLEPDMPRRSTEAERGSPKMQQARQSPQPSPALPQHGPLSGNRPPFANLVALQFNTVHPGTPFGHVAPHAVVKMLGAIHWRLQSSGRHVVSAWLQDTIMQVGRTYSRKGPEFRQALHRALVAEDAASSKHPSQVCPQNCPTPYAFRIWPDKVQALLAFDRVAGGTRVPASLSNGSYAPVVLYRPRFTVVSMTSEDDGHVTLHFAETAQTLRAPFEKICRDLQLPRQRDAKAYRCRTLAALTQLKNACAAHDSYFDQMLAPALAEKKRPLVSLPTFGLCAQSVLKEALARKLSPEKTIENLRKYVKHEQELIATYFIALQMPVNAPADALI